MGPLQQPWKDYLAQKAAMEENRKNDCTNLNKSEPEKAQADMCPGSEECGKMPHPLGSTVSCAFRSHMACEVVCQGTTGTSG